MRFLIMPSPDITMSSVTRCLAVIERLLQESHSIAVVCTDHYRRWFASFDVALFCRPQPSFDPILVDNTVPVRDLTEYASLIGLADPDFVFSSVEAERRAISSFKPDVVFSDFNLTAPISVKSLRLPLISTAQSPFHPRFQSPLFEPVDNRQRLTEPFNRSLAKYGLEPIESLAELVFMRSDARVVPSVRELEPLMRGVSHTYFVGPLLSQSLESQNVPEWIQQMPEEKPVLFVYLSVSDILPSEIIDVIPRAFDGTEFKVVVTFGHHPRARSWPSSTSNVRFEEFVPGTAMLEHSDLLIFHGGQNTLVNALQHRVLSIVFPCLIFERDFNARMIESMGAGIRLPHAEFRPAPLYDTASQLWRRGPRREALEVGKSLASTDGPGYLVRILKEYAAKG